MTGESGTSCSGKGTYLPSLMKKVPSPIVVGSGGKPSTPKIQGVRAVESPNVQAKESKDKSKERESRDREPKDKGKGKSSSKRSSQLEETSAQYSQILQTMQEQQKMFKNFSGFISSMEKFFTASHAPGTAPVIEAEAGESAVHRFPNPVEDEEQDPEVLQEEDPEDN